MGFYQQAADKLKKEFGGVSGQKETAMKTAVRDALLRFAEQDDEFAQAIAQGGSFKDCMQAVAAGVGQSISDLEAYEKATRFYFPGARVRFEMHVDLIGDAAGERGAEDVGTCKAPEKTGLILDLADFL
jgi:hypothetical protein